MLIVTPAELAEHRADALERMESRVAVLRKTGAHTVVDGFKVAEWATVHADLPMRLAGARGGTSSSRRQDLGGTEVEVAVREAHFPFDTTDLADSDYVEITAGENAGVVLRIVEATWQDQATARRMPVVAVVRPKEWS